MEKVSDADGELGDSSLIEVIQAAHKDILAYFTAANGPLSDDESDAALLLLDIACRKGIPAKEILERVKAAICRSLEQNGRGFLHVPAFKRQTARRIKVLLGEEEPEGLQEGTYQLFIPDALRLGRSSRPVN